MKTKRLKKFLAAMIAASSVMAMSGTAMAVKKTPRNEKSQGASKDPNGKQTKRKRRKFVTIKKNVSKGKKNVRKRKKNLNSNESESVALPLENPLTPIYIPRYYMPVPSVKIDIYNGDGDSMMESLVSPADILSKEDDRCVVDITHQIRSFKLNGNLSNLKKCLLEKRVRLATALVNWIKSDCVTRKENVIVAVVDLAENEFFDGFDQTQKLDILRTLVTCFEDRCLGGSNVAWAFKRLVQAGFVAGNEFSEEVLKLQQILSDFEKCADDEPDIGLDYYICHNDCDYDDLEF